MKDDAAGGVSAEIQMVKILLMVEEYDEAIKRLEFLLDYTGNISIEYLKIDPFWKHFYDKGIFKELISNPKYQINQPDN